ncbi:MAG: hypothetical protein QM495_06325 [Lutibacter sp.]
MEDMMWEKATEGVPMHIGHDMHRPIGCMIPYALYFEPSIVRQLGLSLFPETNEESHQILNFKKYTHSKHLKEDIDKNNGELFRILEEGLSEKYRYISAGTLAILENNIVATYFSKLVNLKDKAGLINIKDLEKDFTYKHHGVFIHKVLPLCIYSHSYFRKSLSRLNNFHHLFLDEFMTHKNNNKITLKMAIDWDMIGYAPDFLQTLEFEYWFGPKYNDDISKINPGLTKHICNDFEKQYFEVSSTEFYWKNNKNLKEFELEELKENNVPTTDDFFGCRYIHSIYDTNKDTFIHFDGAIRGYTSELYFDRIDQNMTEFGRRSNYKKLFRIDGDLELKNWKNLITKYMQGNPLIYEYFDIDKPKSQYEKGKRVKTLTEKLVPHSIDEKDGIRLLVSYHNKNEDFANKTHSVSIYDIVSLGNTSHSILEANIIEIKKALERLGRNLFIPNDVLLGSFNDTYWNIPCIFHNRKNEEEDIKITLLALKSVFFKMIERKLDSVISFTLSWNMEDKEVRISCYGHVENLYEWLQSFESIPITRIQFKKWLEDQREYINSNFNGIIDKPLIQDIAQFDGVLFIKRIMIQDEFEPTPIKKDDSLICQFKIPSNYSKDYSEIIEGKIAPIMAYIIDKSTCSKTGLDYVDSPYSKFLDEDVHTIIEKVSSLNFYWSDRPIY